MGSKSAMHKFYKTAGIDEKPGGFSIQLDGKPVKTPDGHMLMTPYRSLAEAVMSEWIDQTDRIDPDSMPLTQLLNAQIDRVAGERPVMSEAVLAYLNTDLVCYRVAEPEELARQQAELWDPALRWFKDTYGEALTTTLTLGALTQPRSAHEKLRTYVENLSDENFTALQSAVPLLGSIVLGAGLVEQALSPEEAFKAARIEEQYQAGLHKADIYGPDPHEERVEAALMRDLIAAARYVEFTNPNTETQGLNL